MHKISQALAAALLIAATSGAAFAQARSPDELYEGLRNEQLCPRVLTQAHTFVQSSSFTGYPVEARLSFIYAVADCAKQAENEAIALSATTAARTLGAEWGDLMLLSVGVKFERRDLILQAFDAMSATAAQTQHIRTEWVWYALRAAEHVDPSGARALAVHNRLANFNYTPPDGERDDYIRLDHARLLVHANRVADARARLATVRAPRAILSIRVDRTFDPLRTDAAFESRLDLAAAGEADLARARSEAAEKPRLIARRLQVAELASDAGPRCRGAARAGRNPCGRHARRRRSAVRRL